MIAVQVGITRLKKKADTLVQYDEFISMGWC